MTHVVVPAALRNKHQHGHMTILQMIRAAATDAEVADGASIGMAKGRGVHTGSV